MASRRSLKKTVNYITELAAGLCLSGGISKRKCRKTGSLQRSIPADYQPA